MQDKQSVVRHRGTLAVTPSVVDAQGIFNAVWTGGMWQGGPTPYSSSLAALRTS